MLRFWLCVLCSLTFFLRTSPATSPRDAVLWSLDNKHAVMGVHDIAAEKRASENGSILISEHFWLLSGDLKPRKRIYGPPISDIVACFSRDGRYLVYVIDDELNFCWKVMRLHLSNPAKVDVIFTARGGYALQIVPEPSGSILVIRAPNLKNLFRLKDGVETQVITRPFPGVLVPYYIDCAHLDCAKDGFAHFEMFNENGHYLCRIPFGVSDLDPDTIKKEVLDQTVFERSADGRIVVRREYEKDGSGRQSIEFQSGKQVKADCVFPIRRDRKQIAWIGPEDRFLYVADGDGKERCRFENLPESKIGIYGFNETLGIVCLEGIEDFYVVDCDSKEVRRLHRGQFLQGDETDSQGLPTAQQE